MRYIQITALEPIKVIDVVTQIHYLLTPGEARNPDATFWDLTVGGVAISSGDDRHCAYLLSSERVTALSNALRTQTWESLEVRAKANLDICPGWQEGLRPEFETLRDFFLDASEKECAVLRVSSKDGFFIAEPIYHAARRARPLRSLATSSTKIADCELRIWDWNASPRNRLQSAIDTKYSNLDKGPRASENPLP